MVRVAQMISQLLMFDLIGASLRINLVISDGFGSEVARTTVQYHCLYVPAASMEEYQLRQRIAYCLSDWSSKWNVSEHHLDQRYTFAQLHQSAVTSEQLYSWSAPLDLIERYEFYLHERPISMDNEIFWNCTRPRFGPRCQYSLDMKQSTNSSLTEIVQMFYTNHYQPNTFSCYIHLKCDRGSTSLCLDWSDVCDDIVDCAGDQIDEKFCWQMKTYECGENEFRCGNGQCIPFDFVNNDPISLECLDQTDLRGLTHSIAIRLTIEEPSFFLEDRQCSRDSIHTHLAMRLTSSCFEQRNRLLSPLRYQSPPKPMSKECWSVFSCYYEQLDRYRWPPRNNVCPSLSQLNATCSDTPIVQTATALFGHISFGYDLDRLLTSKKWPIPDYICYDDRLCAGFHANRTLILLNETTCRRLEDFPVVVNTDFLTFALAGQIYRQLHQCNSIAYNDARECPDPRMYRCSRSTKCIWTSQLCDDFVDCDYGDDQECAMINGTCPHPETVLFRCLETSKCIPVNLVNNGQCDCDHDSRLFCADDPQTSLGLDEQKISFGDICDGSVLSILTVGDGSGETDETNCEHWPCDNIYTHCDHKWHCPDGIDETNCYPTLSPQCPSKHHHCISSNTLQMTCLSPSRVKDGQIDCFGATDEPQFCHETDSPLSTRYFLCGNGSENECLRSAWCSKYDRCSNGYEDLLCNETHHVSDFMGICAWSYDNNRSAVHEFFCQRFRQTYHMKEGFFVGEEMHFPKKRNIEMIERVSADQQIHDCNRGIPLRVWLDSEKNRSATTCLCPPSYYGDRCEYQNERVALTVQFSASSDSRRIPFTIMTSLIDEEQRRIHSYEQHTYLYLEHCSVKFNIYLLYSTRPRNPSLNYSVHIDIFEKISLTYRASFLLPVRFNFLPVNRLAVQLNIPKRSDTCVDRSCLHGRCIQYIDNPSTFCQCEQGWTGKSCHLRHDCQCAKDSICVGVSSANQSVCACPMNRWGARCLAKNDACRGDVEGKCLHSGRCIPDEDQFIRNDKFICICRKGFHGRRCESKDYELRLSFHSDVELPQSMIVHFIRVMTESFDETISNGSTIQTISIHQSVTIVHWSQPFHIAFVQLVHQYYLLVVQTSTNDTTPISRLIQPSDRCRHLNEVIENRFVKLSRLHRMKFYQIPCQKYSPDLKCFYDSEFFCFCYDFHGQRLANCFEFFSDTRQTCSGLSVCENGADCIQDKPRCPKASLCVCPKCYHGTRCQFTSHLFGLSLDAILGYQLQPRVAWFQQSAAVQFTLVSTIVITIVGLVNSFLLLITFVNREPRKTGSGNYLLGSSIASMIIVWMLAMKSIILIVAQINAITNESFLRAQCIAIDFLLRVAMNTEQYLNACVAADRAWTAIKGVNFDKKKSRRVAKYVIALLFLWTTSTTIQDPLHRRLVDVGDDDNEYQEKRIWCVVTYSTRIHVYNDIINLIHFFVPFAINLVSALIIIIVTTRQRSTARRQQTHRKLLFEQIRAHRHLLIAPILLIILALPHLILSFVSDCMKPTGNVWLPLVGFFISFMPSMLTLFIFILPSQSYRNEFRKSIRQLHRTMLQRLRLQPSLRRQR